MKSYLKFLSRNKLYTAIEAVGLAVSLAFVLIIGTSLYDQFRITNALAGSENLYYLSVPDMQGMEYRHKLKLESYPEIGRKASFATAPATLAAESGKRRITVMMADPEILDIIPLKVQEGALDLFRQGSGVILTASSARKFFPGGNMVGESISLGTVGYGGPPEKERDELTVVAVIEDPTFSILADFDVLCPMGAPYREAKVIIESDMATSGFGYLVSVLAEIQPGTDTRDFEEKFCRDIGYRHKDGMLYPLRSLYYHPVKLSGIRQGERLVPQVLSLLGIVLLLSAILIYITLATAVSGRRAKEMATRRLTGASGREIFLRVLAESVLFALICYGLAVLLAMAIVPGLNSIRPTGLTLPFRVSGSPAVIGASLLLVLLIGLLGALAPAKLLSSYRPIDVVTGKVRRVGKMVFNKVCIIVLAFLATMLVCLSLTLEAQLRHLETLDQGIDPESDLFYFNPHRFSSQALHALGDHLTREAGVMRIGYTDGIPGHIRSIFACPDNRSLAIISCDTVAFRLLGFRVKEVYEEMIPGKVWISESTKTAFDISAQSADLSKVMKVTYKSKVLTSICGVIEDVRRITDNGFDPWGILIKEGHEFLPPAVCIYPSEYFPLLSGILIQTSGDHAAFKERFIKTADDFFREQTDAEMPEFGNDKYSQCGYLEEITASDYEELRRYVRVVEVFTIISLLLAMLGLLAICTWYASLSSKDIAIRKVFGGTVKGEAGRIILRYLSYVLIAVVISIPVSIFLTGRLLERWPDRISGYWWIFVVSVLFVLFISTMAILWQSWKAARTNPATELKKE